MGACFFISFAYILVAMTHEGTTGSVPRPKWPELIYKKRKELKESQAEFGKRFDVSQAAVSDWERGISEPPAAVTWWLTEQGVANVGK